MEATDRHYCEKYLCDMAAGACATRYFKVINRPKESLWTQISDANCEVCSEGKRLLKALGKKKVNAYRASVNRIKKVAWNRMGRGRVGFQMYREMEI